MNGFRKKQGISGFDATCVWQPEIRDGSRSHHDGRNRVVGRSPDLVVTHRYKVATRRNRIALCCKPKDCVYRAAS